MRRFQRVGDLPRDGQRFTDRDRPPFEPIGKRLALDELEHERGRAIHVLDAVDGADVRMIQRGQQPRFALEAGEPLGIDREQARKDLDRDVAPELRVARAIDLAHAAGAKPCVNPIRTELPAKHRCAADS